MINILFRLSLGNQQRKVSENSYPEHKYRDDLKTSDLGHNAHPSHFLNCVEIGYEKKRALYLKTIVRFPPPLSLSLSLSATSVGYLENINM
jgi:hypothetical protein